VQSVQSIVSPASEAIEAAVRIAVVRVRPWPTDPSYTRTISGSSGALPDKRAVEATLATRATATAVILQDAILAIRAKSRRIS